jgi:hypothetical protein
VTSQDPLTCLPKGLTIVPPVHLLPEGWNPSHAFSPFPFPSHNVFVTHESPMNKHQTLKISMIEHERITVTNLKFKILNENGTISSLSFYVQFLI